MMYLMNAGGGVRGGEKGRESELPIMMLVAVCFC